MKMPMKKASSFGSLPQMFLMISACCAMLLHEQACLAAPSVVGLWRFNEGSGTNISDSSGLGHNGALGGDNGKLPTWTSGQSGFGHALLFTNDGTNRTYAAIPGSPSLMIGQTPTNGWTITVWAYENSGGTSDFISTYGRLVVIDDGTAQQLESGASGDDEFYTWARITGAWQLAWGMGSPVTPLLDQWEHWAVVYDGTATKAPKAAWNRRLSQPRSTMSATRGRSSSVPNSINQRIAIGTACWTMWRCLPGR
jgi:hypothetical protein